MSKIDELKRYIYEYKFDEGGRLISSEMTDELVRFAR